MNTATTLAYGGSYTDPDPVADFTAHVLFPTTWLDVVALVLSVVVVLCLAQIVINTVNWAQYRVTQAFRRAQQRRKAEPVTADERLSTVHAPAPSGPATDIRHSIAELPTGQNRVTVVQLREWLADVPDHYVVVMDSDAEGNSTAQLAGLTTASYDGSAYDCQIWSGDAPLHGTATRCVVLEPVN